MSYWKHGIIDLRSETNFGISMLEVKNQLRSRARVATLRFQSALSLKNRLRSRALVAILRFQSAFGLKNRFRSRTHVATYMFQNAFNLKNRLLSRTRVINATLKYNTQKSPNGIWCSGTRKWLQRYEIDNFCQGEISAVQPSEIPSESGRGTFGFTYPTSDIHIRPG